MSETRPVSLHLTLPLPPGINSQYVQAGKRRVLSAGARKFKNQVLALISSLRQQPTWDPLIEAQIRRSLVGMYMTFYFETPLKRDLDGGLKIAIDSVAEALHFDDRTVVDLHLTKQIDPLHPRLEMDIETIEDWTFDQSYIYLGESAQSIEPATTD
ncbi:MAG: RusA family crossover junction endodeoxyribonuclease [Thermomicrobiales bacterium]